MRLLAHWPYDAVPLAPEVTWRVFEALAPAGVVLLSHTPAGDVARLLERGVGDWHVRMKLGPFRGSGSLVGHSGLDYREWPTERSTGDLLEQLATAGCEDVCVELLTEPDLELPPEGRCDDPEARAAAIAEYVRWAADVLGQLRRRYPRARPALAALSQGGPPERFAAWRAGLDGLRVWAPTIAEHLYTHGRPWHDPEWGGRWRVWGVPPGRVCVHEFNDDGQLPAEQRASELAGFARYLAAGGLGAAAPFVLPGSARDREQPSWWTIDEQIAGAVAAALRALWPS